MTQDPKIKEAMSKMIEEMTKNSTQTKEEEKAVWDKFKGTVAQVKTENKS